MFTGYWIEKKHILGPEDSGVYWIKNNYIRGPHNNSLFWIKNNIIFGPWDSAQFWIDREVDGRIYGPSTVLPWQKEKPASTAQ